MMAVTKVLHTARATSHGGRNGHTQNGDGLVSVDLSVPKDMGGPGKPNTTTPEDLFAAGYAACLGGAIDYMATQMKLKPRSLEVRTAVGIGTDATGFGLQVDHEIVVEGLSQADAEKIVQAGHTFCPYSKATRGNIEVTVKTVVK
jgi:osmotically inducible protein OsmC